jgi:uncharacterized protein (TIGR02646 family)
MIKIKRGEAPEIFTRKNGPALREKEQAEKFFSTDPLPEGGFVFNFYSRNKNKYKDILVKIFHARCAYCECFVLAGNRGDIEHFRPKGRYIRRDGSISEHGYYWLAADWNNLYLSCTNCNQQTSFDILDTKDPTIVKRRTAGKMEQFALADEKYRRDLHTQRLEEEEPYRLLIDPCRDEPEVLLEFTDNGILRPRQQQGIEYDKASYSIDTYVLQRDILVKTRREKYLQVMNKIHTVDKFLGYVMNDIRDGVQSRRHEEDKEQLQTDFLLLLDMLKIDKIPNEYIGLARQYIHPFHNSYSVRVSDFLDLGKGAAWYDRAVAYFRPQMKALMSYSEAMEEYSKTN